MFCEHAFDWESEDLVRDARGRVLCPRCVAYCEACGRVWFRLALRPGGLCADCFSPRNASRASGANQKNSISAGAHAAHGVTASIPWQKPPVSRSPGIRLYHCLPFFSKRIDFMRRCSQVFFFRRQALFALDSTLPPGLAANANN